MAKEMAVRDQPLDVVGVKGESSAETYLRMKNTAAIVNGVVNSFEPGIDVLYRDNWPTPLLQLPGMDKLLFAMGLVKDFEFLDKVEKWDGQPPLFVYRFKAIVTDKWTGMVVAQGFGVAHSKESGVGKQTPANILNQVNKIDAVGRSRALRDALFSLAPIRRRFDVASDIEMTHPDVVEDAPVPEVTVSEPASQASLDEAFQEARSLD